MPLLTIQSGNVASALPSGYDVANSLRFNGADSARLSIANPTAGNRKTGSLSFWIKFCDLNANHNIFNTYNSSASGYSSALLISPTLISTFSNILKSTKSKINFTFQLHQFFAKNLLF